MKKPYKKILIVLLVVNFLALVIALSNFIENNPLKEYWIYLGISFVVLAGFARQCCKNSKKETDN